MLQLLLFLITVAFDVRAYLDALAALCSLHGRQIDDFEAAVPFKTSCCYLTDGAGRVPSGNVAPLRRRGECVHMSDVAVHATCMQAHGCQVGGS